MIASKSFLKILCGISLVLSTRAAICAESSSQLDGEKILQKADSYRNFKNRPFSFDLEMINYMPGRETQTFNLKVEISDSHHSLVIYKAPQSEKGKAILMQNRDLWFHTPNNKNPIRITPQQRFLGEAANGDVATTDFLGDYQVSAAINDTVDGLSCHKLTLVPKPGAIATYDKVDLWVKATDSTPYKADFYGSSGKLLKHARYEKYEKLTNLGGRLQLTEIEISHPTNKEQRTKMRYFNFKEESIPDSHFETNYLKRVE